VKNQGYFKKIRGDMNQKTTLNGMSQLNGSGIQDIQGDESLLLNISRGKGFSIMLVLYLLWFLDFATRL